MIPAKLSLRNFMCYRDNVPPLYFDSFHVACLCGDNGHGKSALLDAITWALWGKARGVEHRNSDKLVHLGQAEMEVEFEFIVGPNRYRVIRKWTKSSPRRGGGGLLELHLAADGGFKAITGNNMDETQQRIIEILRMDYETFINSALLLQGRADAFTTKTPAERKKILADILGLSLYDRLEEAAKNCKKERESAGDRLSSAIANINEDLARKGDYETELSQAEESVHELDARVGSQQAIANGLRQAKWDFDRKKDELGELERRISERAGELERQRRQFDGHRARIERYQRILADYPQELAKIKLRLDELSTMEGELSQKRGQAEQLSNRIHYLRSANAQLKEEMNELKEKLDLLARGEAKCPLCGAELGIEGRDRIMANYKAQGQDKGDSYRTNEAESRQQEQELNTLKQEITKLERTMTIGRARCQAQAEVLAKDRAESESSLPEEKEALAGLEQALARLDSALSDDSQKRKALLAELAASPDPGPRLEEADRSYSALLAEQARGRERLGAVQQKLAHLARLETVKLERTKGLAEVVKEKAIYDELALAFGKRGIQALIVESALPEIERDATELLSRMTDNQMHLKIESQRDTRKGETIETLEIKISDELGTRSYEMFSGGEAFRINFALRIALSKLLARRAGAPLPTLIIDEGFGTQDSAGKEKLVEAINSIQDDFEKIIVITHIEELKDAFPVRIEVTKSGEGSMISVS